MGVENRYVVPEVTVTVAGMDKAMSQTTREEVLKKLRRRYQSAGPEYKRKLLDEAQGLLGYHRKAAIRSLRAPTIERGPRIITGRPVTYEPGILLPYLRPIWAAADYACGRRLVAMLPEWIPACEQYERRMPGEVREKLLAASGRTLDRLLEPLRVQGRGRSLTRPGTLLRQQIPIRGSVWEEGKAGWLEVDTVALCGGSAAGEYVWMGRPQSQGDCRTAPGAPLKPCRKTSITGNRQNEIGVPPTHRFTPTIQPAPAHQDAL